ncbi:MAG: DUF4351 domain-containing protein [Spirulinaceae cyanobacterium SM2_1_0]|nr:DUF4351 domain-containing protein [Spirulinaceae cyanobacterium SM2_1_0]
MLQQVAAATRQVVNPTQRREIVACTAIMSGLIHNPETIQDLFGEDLLEDSSFYQFILQKGRQQGLQQGLQEGLQQGLQEGLQQGERNQAILMALRLLHRQFGLLPAATEQQIRNLSLAQLEVLMEALLDFSQLQDLTDWLASVPQ